MNTETFYDWLVKKDLYDHYNGMDTYVREYIHGYPDMDPDVAQRYTDECYDIIQQFKEDV